MYNFVFGYAFSCYWLQESAFWIEMQISTKYAYSTGSVKGDVHASFVLVFLQYPLQFFSCRVILYM